MAEAIIEFFLSIFGNIELTTFVVSAIPLVELRGSIPLGVGGGLHPLVSFLLSYLGTVSISILLFFLLKPVLNLLKRIKIFKNLALSIEDHIRQKAEGVGEKGDVEGRENFYKTMGVALFIGVPLPMTGTWTGTAIAVFLDMKFRHAIVGILLGNLMAGGILTLLTIFFEPYIDLIITILFAIIAVVILIVVAKFLLKSLKKNKDTQTDITKK